MSFKKFLASFLPFLLILFFTACGCKHEWSEATCINLKTCNLCGVTDGELNAHNYIDANCENPKRCSFCDATVGKSLGHNYKDGVCLRCYQKDPDYVDLNNLGFLNNYGMNIWLMIDGYDFSNNKVYVLSIPRRPSLHFKVFNNNYFNHAVVWQEDITSPYVSENMFEIRDTTIYNVVSNDVISYNSNDDGPGTATIIDKVVDLNNSKLVIKTDFRAYGGEDEYWFVPADLLDFSTVKLEEFYSNATDGGKYSICFK